jgi:glucosamine--fructose-6-phosphate aminotransferase (isomerizing)
MIVAAYMFGFYLGQERGVLDKLQREHLLQDLVELPGLVGKTLANGHDYEALAQRYFKCRDFLYLGRGVNYPVALEGALKLKEISYIHAEGYPGGEMKHGPIALIDENMPVVAIAVRDNVRDKMLSNIEQVRARGGIVIAIATEGDQEIADKANHTLFVPAASPLLTPVLTTIPLQLLAYHVAVRLGCDVDQPRNLAKSVTVE